MDKPFYIRYECDCGENQIEDIQVAASLFIAVLASQHKYLNSDERRCTSCKEIASPVVACLEEKIINSKNPSLLIIQKQ